MRVVGFDSHRAVLEVAEVAEVAEVVAVGEDLVLVEPWCSDVLRLKLVSGRVYQRLRRWTCRRRRR